MLRKREAVLIEHLRQLFCWCRMDMESFGDSVTVFYCISKIFKDLAGNMSARWGPIGHGCGNQRASQGRLRDWSIHAPQPLKDRSLHPVECTHFEIVIETLPFNLVCFLKRKCVMSPPVSV